MSARTRVNVEALTLPGVIGSGAVAPLATPDGWGRLIEAGTRSSRFPAPARRVPEADAADRHLLAFHHAQDAAHVPRMLAAADRLDRLGDRDAAEYARHEARTLAGSKNH